jgi:ABC-type uncharacterized transport system permease subunit
LPLRLLQQLSRSADAAWSLAAVVISLACLAPLIALAGADVGRGYAVLFGASFGSMFGFGAMLTASVPLILVSLGVALPYRAGLFNVGGEGQLVLGALAAVLVGVTQTWGGSLPGSWVVSMAAAVIAGGALASIAGLLKAWRGVNEIITTIMLNFLALLLVQNLVSGPFKQKGLQYASSPAILPAYQLPALGGDAQIPSGILVALACALLMWALAEFSRFGWRQRIVGLSQPLATRQGVGVQREQFAAMVLGGALAGLGGACEALGNQFRIGLHFSPGWGFDAVAIALLARGQPLLVVLYAIFFAVLRTGSSSLQTDLNVPGTLVLILAGLPVIAVAAIIGFRSYRSVTAARSVTEPSEVAAA